MYRCASISLYGQEEEGRIDLETGEVLEEEEEEKVRMGKKVVVEGVQCGSCTPLLPHFEAGRSLPLLLLLLSLQLCLRHKFGKKTFSPLQATNRENGTKVGQN